MRPYISEEVAERIRRYARKMGIFDKYSFNDIVEMLLYEVGK
jgi:hypothetical protein